MKKLSKQPNEPYGFSVGHQKAIDVSNFTDEAL